MLLSSVIIILREVLEAALLFSILLALSKQLGLSPKWTFLALLTGLAGAIFYSQQINTISYWFDGVGQEVSNALIQIGIYFLLVLYLFILVRYRNQQHLPRTLFIFTMISISTLAIIHEGSEIILYFFSVTHNNQHLMTVLIGMGIGSSIGISIGLLFYYLLCNLASRWSINLGTLLLLLVAASMISQASLLLIQADWLPSHLPLWDSSYWISEQSITGQLLYAIIGYEATPTALQFGLYLTALLLPTGILLFLHYMHLKNRNSVCTRANTPAHKNPEQ